MFKNEIGLHGASKSSCVEPEELRVGEFDELESDELINVDGDEIAESVLDEKQVLTIDLTNVCFADCEGITVLMSLLDRGARDVNAPLFVAEQIRKCKDAGRRQANDGAPVLGGER